MLKGGGAFRLTGPSLYDMADTLHLSFRAEKAIQLFGLIFHDLNVRKMTYGRLLKLAYLVDRAALVEIGHPITDDRMIAMDRGFTLADPTMDSKRPVPPA